MAGETPHEAAMHAVGLEDPARPVLVSVPHAGRHYPPALLNRSRLGPAELRQLEDRHIDAPAEALAERGFPVLVARTARAWIDLNRSERELDQEMFAPTPRRADIDISLKVRGGLGLVPRRLPGHGDIYDAPVCANDLAGRIESVHRPYHQAIAETLARIRRRFGAALLLDLHSMPPLKPRGGLRPSEIVIGDRHGRTAGRRFVQTAVEVCRAHGFSLALNSPYAGGYLLDRHGRPGEDVHALQIEIGRGVYLDEALDEPGPGMPRISALLTELCETLAEKIGGAMPLAAE